jgi:hypothetical protein
MKREWRRARRSVPLPLRFIEQLVKLHRRSAVSLIALCAGLVVSCGGGKSHMRIKHARAQTHRVREAPREVRRAKLHYDVAGLAPLPFVRGTVGDEPTWMLVDTGAATHVATSQIAKRGGVRTATSSEELEDHSRATLSAARADLSQISLEGWGKMPRGRLLVIEQEEGGIAAKANVGVFLSPQKLGQSLEDKKAMVLDLRAAEMRIVGEDEVSKVLGSRPHDPLVRGVRACNGVFVVQAEIEGEPVNLILDTGATRSTLYEATAAGKRLAPKAVKSTMRGEAPSGKVESRTYPGARIASGGLSVTSDLELFAGSPPSDCSNDGVLGFPALRSCVLVFGPQRGQLRARCG